MKRSRRALLPLLALSTALSGADWPGRERELAEAVQTASPARRAELLVEIAASPGPDSESVIVHALTDADAAVRMAAAGLVSRYRMRSAAPILAAWLSDPQADVRAAGAHALGAIGDRQSNPALLRLLGDSDVRVRLAAVEALAAIGGPEATVSLLDRLADPESSVRIATARALGNLGDARAVLSLLGALQDSMPEVREATATALGKLRDARAVRGLLGLLRDPQMEVRLSATRALGTLGATEAVIDLAPLALREERANDPLARAQIARAAVDAIGRIGGPTARDVLVRAYRRSDTDPDLARAAADAIRGLGAESQNAIPGLVAAPISSALIASLVQLLGDIGGERAADALVAIYESPDGARVPELTLRAIGRTGTPRALRTLLRAAASSEERERTPGGGPSTAVNPGARLDLRHRGAIAGLEAYAHERGGIDAEALDPLIEVLAAGSRGLSGDLAREFVASVARLIGETHNPRAPRVLGPLLASNHRDVRGAAAAALASVGVTGVESATAAALADSAPEVRLAAADALGKHGAASALDALLALWSGNRPFDRTNAARAVGRIAARIHDPRGARVLTAALPHAASGLEAALVDSLAYLAQSGDLDAARALTARVDSTRSPAAVIEALGNALAGAPEAVRAIIAPRVVVAATTETTAPSVRAAAVWALARTPDAQSRLLALLADPNYAVVTNAAGGLARVYAGGTAPSADAGEVLCRTLPVRRHPAVRTNVLLALAHGHLGCGVEIPRRILAEGRAVSVRRAAADALSAAIVDGNAESARVVHAALETCATADRNTDVAARCRHLLEPAVPTTAAPTATAGARSNAPATETLDAMVMAGNEDTVAAVSAFALVMSDGVVRVGSTGPSGWIHERPAPVGSYVVLDPDAQAPEP